MFDWFRDLIDGTPDDVTVTPVDAVEHFDERCGDRIQAVQGEAAERRDVILEQVAGVEDALQQLQDYEHERTQIEAVTQNVADYRLHVLSEFDAPDDPEAFHEQVADLVDECSTVSQKENAVLDRVGETASETFRRIRKLDNQVDEYEAFLEDEYVIVTDRERLQELVDELAGLQEEEERLQEELDAVDLETPRKQRDEAAEELDALEDDPEQEQKEVLEEELAKLEEERDRLRNDVARAAANMERGLKKLLYATRNGDVSLDHEHVSVLESVRDGRIAQEFTEPASDIAAAVSAAADAIDQIDLGDRQREKFRDGADRLQELDQIRSEMEQITDKIADKQAAIDDLGIEERRRELERERNRHEQELQDRAERRTELRQRIDDIQKRQETVLEQIEELCDRHMDADVTVQPPS